MKKILISIVLFLTLFCSIYFKVPTASAKETWNYQDCIELKNFIEENFDQFVLEYNKANQSALKASSIEYATIINLIEDENFGIYLDFNEYNGYCVLTGDFTIYELEVEGDYEKLRELEELSYSYIDGFVYKDEHSLYQRLIEKTTSSSEEIKPMLYPGQTKAGDGNINYIYINDYIDARYPDYQYEGQNVNLRNSFNFNIQSNLSFFNQYKCNADGSIYDEYKTYTPEGNCTLTAMTNILTFWRKEGYVNNIDYSSKTDIRDSIVNDSLYNVWGIGKNLFDSNGNVVGDVKHVKVDGHPLRNGGFGDYDYYCWKTTSTLHLMGMSNLYINIRECAVKKFNYTPISGLYDYQSKKVMCEVAKEYYNQNITINSTDSLNSAIDSIDEGKAVYLGINGSSTYEDHAVVLFGYQKYSYTTGWWIFKKTHYAYFFEVADGWSSSSIYFDPNTEANPSLNYLILS